MSDLWSTFLKRFDATIKAEALAAAKELLPSHVRRAMPGILVDLGGKRPAPGLKLTQVGFTSAVAARFHELGETPEEACRLARITVAEFLRDERCCFGDPDYCWDFDGARELADEVKQNA